MNIDGVYKCKLEFNPDGCPLHLTRMGVMVLYEDENQLKGRMFPTYFWLNSPFRCGKIDGNKFKFTVHFATPCQQFSMDVSGEVNDGVVTGTADTPTGPYLLTGTRISDVER
ncbi:MAG: hypothetical protein LUE92_06285 [Clostridiales bacterium]|nr:hypothetical protein [Clostridiales bacterium]